MRRTSLFVIILGLSLSACSPQWNMPISYDQLLKAAQSGDIASEYNLGVIYLEGKEMKQNVTEGLSWLAKAADQGEVRAMFNLGLTYYQGTLVKQDLPKAREWFTKAVAQGNDRATYNLGVMEYQGQGGPQDLSGALVLFTNAAKKGMSEAAVNLGVMLAKGEGVSKPNALDAAAWFTIAKEEGDAKAASILSSAVNKLTADEKTALEARVAQLKKTITYPASSSVGTIMQNAQ